MKQLEEQQKRRDEYHLVQLHYLDAKDIVKEISVDIYEEYNIHSGSITLEWFEGYQSGFKDVLRLLNISVDDLQKFIDYNEEINLDKS